MSKRSTTSYNIMNEPSHSENVQQTQEVPNLVRLRQKSADAMNLSDALSLKKMQAYLRVQKTISDFELMEIRQICAQKLQKAIKDQSDSNVMNQPPSSSTPLINEHHVHSFFPPKYDTASYFQVSLARILKLLDQFIKTEAHCSVDLCMNRSTEVIANFQSIREQVKNAEGVQECTMDTDKPFLNSMLNKIRFILSRFARLINLYEAMLVKYLSLEQGVEQYFDPSEKKKKSVAQVLNKLTDVQKSQSIVQHCFKEETAQWRSELEAELFLVAPVVTCRICQNKFYASKALRHGQFCGQRATYSKLQRL